MNCNVGKSDQIIRIAFGCILVGAGFFLPGAIGIVLWVAGAVALLTEIIGYCPAYSMIRINTCKKP